MKSLFFTFLFILSGVSALAQENYKQENPLEEVVSFAGLDVKPEFPGGNYNFNTEVMKNLRIPEINTDLDVRVYVTFVVEKDGSLSNVKCTRDPGHGLGQECVNAVKAVKTKWNPGINNDKKVRVQYTLPIIIRIKSDPKPMQEVKHK